MTLPGGDLGANWHSLFPVPVFSMRFSISDVALGFSLFISKGNGVWGISLFLADSLISFPYDAVSSLETGRVP